MKMSLEEAKAMFVEFTAQKGVLRCLKPDEDRSRATGLNFVCPMCPREKAHGITFLFSDPRVPHGAKPPGRWLASKDPLKFLSVVGRVKSDHCSFECTIRKGWVMWM